MSGVHCSIHPQYCTFGTKFRQSLSEVFYNETVIDGSMKHLYGALAAMAIGSGCAHAPSSGTFSIPPTACTTDYELNSDSRLASIIAQFPPGTIKRDTGKGAIEYRNKLSLRPTTVIGINTMLTPSFVLEIGDITYTERINEKKLTVEAMFKYSTGTIEHVLLCETTNAKGKHSEKEYNMHYLVFRKAESTLLHSFTTVPPIQAPTPSPGFRIASIQK